MHYSVMLKESIEGLNIKSDGIYVDATLGYGGHSSEILKKLTTGHLYCFDQDQEAITYSAKKLEKINSNFDIIHANFSEMVERLKEYNVTSVDGIIFDLGNSSPQIDNEKRGFSFMKDSKLDMRMNLDNRFSALNVVNEYSLEKLTNIFYQYAEEKYSRSIAKNIIKNRPITNTLELVEVIKQSVPYKYYLSRHPERVIFQAIRIEVNDELNILEEVLPKAIKLLNKKGRISIITFHSLEDKIAKKTFKKYSEVNDLVKGLPSIPDAYKPLIKLVNKKVITACKTELQENSRSKSAKLRIIERV